MHEFGLTSIHGFAWGCGLAVFHRVIRLFHPAVNVVLYGLIGGILSRYCFSNERSNKPANKPMTSAEVFLSLLPIHILKEYTNLK